MKRISHENNRENAIDNIQGDFSRQPEINIVMTRLDSPYMISYWCS